VAVDFSSPELQPCFDPDSHLVYVAGRENVSHVWVAGEAAVEEGVLARPELRAVGKLATQWQTRIAALSPPQGGSAQP
jgi:5-methylthioadenosine/S-adenosylhomocysteine deaminase